jgi:hypothetical protein
MACLRLGISEWQDLIPERENEAFSVNLQVLCGENSENAGDLA